MRQGSWPRCSRRSARMPLAPASSASLSQSSLQSAANFSTASARPCSASVAVASPILTVTGPFSRNTASRA